MDNYDRYTQALSNADSSEHLSKHLEAATYGEYSFYAHLSRVIGQERRRRGLSQAKLAELVGCDTRTIGRIEAIGSPRAKNKKIDPSEPYTIYMIFAALEIPSEYLLPLK